MISVRKIHFVILFTFGLGLFSNCQRPEANVHILENAIADFKKSSGIDGRLTFYDIKLESHGSAILLKGKLDADVNRDEFIQFVKEKTSSANIIDSLTILKPIDQKLVKVSVCNVRSKPKHSAELSTQHLMGYPVKVYESATGWDLCKGPDGYIGWITTQSLTDYDKKEWPINSLGFVTAKETVCSQDGQIISDLVFGNIVRITDKSGREVTTIELPDKRVASIETKAIVPLNSIAGSVNIDPEEYINTAFSFMGRPYLWGGTSSKGMDCSGFTRTSMLGQGVIIGRDASLQALQGKEIVVDKGFSNLQKGDLLFFGKIREDGSKRVTHVGFHLDKGRFLHESIQVKVESINPQHEDFNIDRANTFLMARRLDNTSIRDLVQLKDLF